MKPAKMDINILSVMFLLYSGGRDRRGGPVLTFPSRSNHDRIRTDDLRRLIAYLAGIPRLNISLHLFCDVRLSKANVCESVVIFLKEEKKRRGASIQVHEVLKVNM